MLILPRSPFTLTLGAGLAALALTGCTGMTAVSTTGSSSSHRQASASSTQATSLPAATTASTVLSVDYPSYITVDGLREASTLSVVGRIVNSRTEIGDLMAESGATHNPQANDPLILPYTVYTMEVSRVLKGGAEAAGTLEFRVLGGTMNGESFAVEGAPVLTPNTAAEYLVNLAGGGTYPDLVNMTEGVFKLEGSSLEPVTATALPATEMTALEQAVENAPVYN